LHSEPSLLGVLRAKMRGAVSSKAKLRGHPKITRRRAARSSRNTSSRWLETVNATQGGWRTARFSTFRNRLTSTPGRRSLIELVNYARLDWLTLFVQNYCGRETLRGTNLSPSDFGLSVPRCCTGVFMLQRSYFWHQAQVCMSLARVTDDPVLKERYEDLAINFVRNADRERDRDGKQTCLRALAGLDYSTTDL